MTAADWTEIASDMIAIAQRRVLEDGSDGRCTLADLEGEIDTCGFYDLRRLCLERTSMLESAGLRYEAAQEALLLDPDHDARALTETMPDEPVWALEHPC